MCRRSALVLGAISMFAGTRSGHAQVSQRARQVRERAACEDNLPTCRPEIRAQLEAERSRIRWGLAGLAVLASVGGMVMSWRIRALKRKENRDLHRLRATLHGVGGDSAENRAKSTNHD